MLVLDQFGNMDWLAGVDATTKRIDMLHTAASNICRLVQANHGVGMVDLIREFLFTVLRAYRVVNGGTLTATRARGGKQAYAHT